MPEDHEMSPEDVLAAEDVQPLIARGISVFEERKTYPLWKILAWCVGAVLTNVAQAVTLKQCGNYFPQYPYFIFWFTAIPFVIVFWTMLAGVWFFTKDITPEMRKVLPQVPISLTAQVPQYKFFIVGLLTTLNGVFMLFSNAHVSGLMQALLGPTIITIPLSMIFAYFLLRQRFNKGQLFGALIIISGVLIVVLPATLGAHGTTQDTAGWALTYMFGSVPLTLANVYQEKALSESPIHICYMLAFSVLYQFFTIIAAGPVDMIPGFGTATPSTFIEHQWEGVRCFFNLHGAPSDCSGAWVPVMMFVLAYVSTNFTMLGVIKYGSAVFAFICTTLVTPLTEFAFAIPFIMGDDVETLRWYHGASLGVLVVGVGIYRYFDVKKAREEENLDPSAAVDVAPTIVISYIAAPAQKVRRRPKKPKTKPRPERRPYFSTFPQYA